MLVLSQHGQHKVLLTTLLESINKTFMIITQPKVATSTDQCYSTTSSTYSDSNVPSVTIQLYAVPLVWKYSLEVFIIIKVNLMVDWR